MIGYIRSEMAKANNQSEYLINRKKILQAKLTRLDNRHASDADKRELIVKIDAVEKEYQDMEPRIVSLEDQLRFVVYVLTNPEQIIRARAHKIYLSRLGVILKGEVRGSGYELLLSEIEVANRKPRVAALVSFSREELLPVKDFLYEADIFLSQ